MSTLIIHPDDVTTNFLKPIYSSIKDKTVITGGITTNQLIREIENHERVMMMGHGSPSGLLSVGKFKNYYGMYIIDEETVPYLSGKKDSVFIWCYADCFVNKHQLNGIYSGMFVSEVSEAIACGLSNVTQQQVTESNDSFGKVMGDCIGQGKNQTYQTLRRSYGTLAKDNPVVKYNHDRLYIC